MPPTQMSRAWTARRGGSAGVYAGGVTWQTDPLLARLVWKKGLRSRSGGSEGGCGGGGGFPPPRRAGVLAGPLARAR